MAMCCPLVLAAQVSVRGTVMGSDQGALAGAHLILSETYKGTVSASDGSFYLGNLSREVHHLEVSFMGYEELEYELDLTQVEGDELVLEVPIILQVRSYLSDEVVVRATRADERVPMTNTTMDKEAIEAQYFGQDMPIILDQTTSVVTTSDAGTGIGYTGMRLRGSDQTRVNVTLNGVPMNDPESQGVFWVNLPDFAASAENIQVQRGVGTSTNGVGAFGGSINIKTDNISQNPYALVGVSAGSFNTQRYSIKLGSGLINNHFAFDGRLSKIKSDGYVDRATSDLESYFLSGVYVAKNTLVKLITFSGKERTYQAWGGIPKAALDTNRTYNPYTYENEVDNYKQTHYQLHLDHKFSSALGLHLTLFRIEGEGYFEQYKDGEDLADYGIFPVVGSDTVAISDLIRRRWLDNHFTGGNLALDFEKNKWRSTLGLNYSTYTGDHFGEVIWAQFMGDSPIRQRYYDNVGNKDEYSAFLKVGREVAKKVNLFSDLQVRNVNYEFLGPDDDGELLDQKVDYTFFNPKAGLTWDPSPTHRLYYSFAVANKEPNRNDFTESSPDSRPDPERLLDHELGYRFRAERLVLSANLYYMDYRDQLVLTGELNDVGAATRTNVDRSYRTGIEVEAAVRLTKKLHWNLNAAFSQNKVKDFVEYVDNWDTWGQEAIEHGDSDLAFSPSVIAASDLSFQLFQKEKTGTMSLSLVSKYVGDQYFDNSSSSERQLDAYFVNDVRLNWDISVKHVKHISLMLMARNIFDVEYVSNAWVYRYSTGGVFQQDAGYFPQAGANFMASLNFLF